MSLVLISGTDDHWMRGDKAIFSLLLIMIAYTLITTLNFIVVVSQISHIDPYVQVEINATCTVTYVIDGDTFDCESVGRVRLDDINAPELDQTGGQEAKNALRELVLYKRVYLDIDDLEPRDKYGRVVAVVYVRFNETHLLNVNKWLVEKGYAEIWDFNNESNPSKWRLYEYYPVWLEEAITSSNQGGNGLLVLTRLALENAILIVLVFSIVITLLLLAWREKHK
jgi:endonuclease YncB( thermonuclease family)